MKKAFTIVELMVVLGIIAILLTLVTTAASNSIREARERKAQACCVIVQQGLATYYAQKARWPGSVGDRIYSGNVGSRSNDEGVSGRSDPDKYVLTASEIDDMIVKLIQETKRGNPLMDISGLFVSRGQGEQGSREYGLDFMQAVRGTKQSRKKMKVAEMHFGYPEKNHGYFRRFKVVYSIPTDEMKVSQQ